MKSLLARWCVCLLVTATGSLAQAAPTVPAGYAVELYASGIGAANQLALDPSGVLYINDYLNGQLLRRNASGGVDVVASGVANSNGLAITASGRIFVTGNSCCVYEVVGGVAQLVTSVFPNPSSLAARGDDVFVSYAGGISKIATLTGAVTTVLTSIGNPFGLSFDALGNLYVIDHGPGALYTYNFVDPPRLLATINPYSGTYTGLGFNGQLFWGDYRLGTLFRLAAANTPEAWATGFGPSAPPVNGPNGIIAQGSNAILVADGHVVWRISQLPVAEGTTHERSMQLRETKAGWVVDCTVRYDGVDGGRRYRVRLTADGPGIGAVPLTTTVGPGNRSFVLRVAGVQESRAQLTGNDLRLEQVVYLAAPPVGGSIYSCIGSARDVTGGGSLPSIFMQDLSR